MNLHIVYLQFCYSTKAPPIQNKYIYIDWYSQFVKINLSDNVIFCKTKIVTLDLKIYKKIVKEFKKRIICI